MEGRAEARSWRSRYPAPATRPIGQAKIFILFSHASKWVAGVGLLRGAEREVRGARTQELARRRCLERASERRSTRLPRSASAPESRPSVARKGMVEVSGIASG